MKSVLFTWALSLFSTLVGGATFSNPLRTVNGSDPFLVYVNGYYYLMTTTWRNVQIVRAKTLEGLKTGEAKTIYTMSNPKPEGNDVWAPELHKINGTWYVYFSEDRKSWVLTGGSEPWGPYDDNKKQVHQEWGIDGTIVDVQGWGNHFVWSCMTPDELQSLCIAKLLTPTSIGPFSTLSQPTEPWERVEIPVNEGPVGLYHGNKTWIAYAASFCKTPDYAVGTLLWDGQNDPLKATSWTKSGGPVFSSANGNYGTGHNGCVTSHLLRYNITNTNLPLSASSPALMGQRSGTSSTLPKIRLEAAAPTVRRLLRRSTGMPMARRTLAFQSSQGSFCKGRLGRRSNSGNEKIACVSAYEGSG